MPINPELKHLYPPDWKAISHRVRFERAGGKCERCGVPHGAKKNETSGYECAVCGERAARLIVLSKVFGRGSKRMLIEGIPTYHCRNCGSEYLDGETMNAIDEIRTNPAEYTTRQTIAAATLAA